MSPAGCAGMGSPCTIVRTSRSNSRFLLLTGISNTAKLQRRARDGCECKKAKEQTPLFTLLVSEKPVTRFSL